MEKYDLLVEEKEYNGKIYKNYYVIVDNQKVYFTPKNYQLWNYITNKKDK